MVGPGGGTAAVQIPVPQPEGDHVGGPDHPAGGQHPGGVAGEELVVGEDVLDQVHSGEQVRHRDEGDHHARDDPQPGFLRSIRPGSPMTRAASNASRTVGTTQAGSTRYFTGSATCRPATTMTASATGHQRSPCSLARCGVTGDGASDFPSDVIPHCDPAGQAINRCGHSRHCGGGTDRLRPPGVVGRAGGLASRPRSSRREPAPRCLTCGSGCVPRPQLAMSTTTRRRRRSAWPRVWPLCWATDRCRASLMAWRLSSRYGGRAWTVMRRRFAPARAWRGKPCPLLMPRVWT